MIALVITLAMLLQATIGPRSMTASSQSPPAASGAAAAHRDRAKALLDQGQMKEATEEFERAIQLDASDAWTHYWLGFTYTSRAQEADGPLGVELLARAVAALNASVERNAQLAEPQNELGTAHALQGRPADAIAAYARAITLRPDWATPRYNLAALYVREEKFEKALEMYSYLLLAPGQFSDSLYQVHNGIATAYSRAGQPQQAATAYRHAIALNGDYYPARVGLGNVYFELTQFEAAAAQYIEAIRLQPQDPALDFFVCRVYALVNKDEETFKWLESALQKGLDPEAPKHSPLLRRLSKDPRFLKLMP